MSGSIYTIRERDGSRTCFRTRLPLPQPEAERLYAVHVEDGEEGGFLSQEAAREEAPALWAMVETFHWTGVAELSDQADVEKFVDTFEGAALTTAVDPFGAAGLDGDDERPEEKS